MYRHATLRLADGRRLGYCELGDPSGLALLACHGGSSCRLELRFAEALCRRGSIRLVVPDRPGIGTSDFQPDRRLADWPRDVEALADALGLERFWVMGWSAGGPYALACGWALAARVQGVLVLAGLAPLRDAAQVAQLGLALDRLLLRLGPRAPRLAAAGLDLLRALPLPAKRGALRRSLRASGDPDLGHLSGAAVDALVEAWDESLRPGGRGTAWDYRVLAEDWGFQPREVEVKVELWQGLEDRLVPPEHACRLAAEIPGARLVPLAGHGHFLPQRCLERILAPLSDRPSRPPAQSGPLPGRGRASG